MVYRIFAGSKQGCTATHAANYQKVEATVQEQSGTCRFISTVQPDIKGMAELLHAILRVSNVTGLATRELLLGTLDDEKVQAIERA